MELSRRLVTIRRDVEVPEDPEALRPDAPDRTPSKTSTAGSSSARCSTSSWTTRSLPRPGGGRRRGRRAGRRRRRVRPGARGFVRDGAHRGSLRPVDGPDRGGGVLRLRHRDDEPRLRGRAGRRGRPRDRPRRGGLRPVRAPLPRGAGPARRGTGARRAPPAPRGSGPAQDRSQPQVRHERPREPRHRDGRGGARHHAPVLRARQHRDPSRHGLPRDPLPRGPHPQVRGGGGQGGEADHLRPGPARRGRALRRGGRGGDPSPARLLHPAARGSARGSSASTARSRCPSCRSSPRWSGAGCGSTPNGSGR